MRELRFIAIEGVIGAGKTSLAKVLAKLEALGYVPPAEQEDAYTADEEAAIEARLAALGYL